MASTSRKGRTDHHDDSVEPMDVSDIEIVEEKKKPKPTKKEPPLWVTKYRPKEFKEIVGNDAVIARLAQFAKAGNTPNLILAGPPGVGKTTTILCLARIMLGDKFDDAVLELNASNERGVDVVRNKIKMFARKQVTLPDNKHKIIILDEADSMTEGAQNALRRTMELYTKTTRFALACNNSEKIIPPIQSRCAVIRFGKLPDEKILVKLDEICKAEDVKSTDDGLEAVVFTAQGDLRQAINNLQATHNGFGKVTSETVFKVCDEPSPLMVNEMVMHAKAGAIKPAYDIIAKLWKLGYSPEDIISNVFRVTKTADLPEAVKLDFIKEIGLTQIKIAEGLGTLVQLTGLVANMCAVGKAYKPVRKWATNLK